MIKYKSTKLSNGLVVIVEQDKSTLLCAVNMLYKVGSKDEDVERTGFAHLFEHLMFSGSENAPNFDYILQNANGESNAFTNSDYTNYYNILPAENIETALWLEADRMTNLNINEVSLEVQKKVVIEEFKEVCLNKPYGDSWHHLSALAYQKHPYQWPTIGKEPKHVAEANLDEVKSFYNKYYNPSNAILSISGPLDHKVVFELADKWFGSIKGNITEQKEFIQEESQLGQRYKAISAYVPVSQFLAACHMPSRRHDRYYACDLLTDILANGKSSRLHQSLVRSKEVLSTVDCYLTGTFDPGLIIMEGRPAKNKSVEECLEYLWNDIMDIQSNPPDKRELQKVKNKVISSLAMSDLSVLNKAISMAYFEWLGDLDLINRQEKIYENVTVEDLLEVAQKYLTPEKSSIVEYKTTH